MDSVIKDIKKALEKYPSLQLIETNNKLKVRGTFTAHQGDISIESYDIEIKFGKRYPYIFPKVFELSNKIQPRDGTRHINNDGSLCLGNLIDEFKVCKNGLSFIFFIEKILNPHLCREYVREKEGAYPTGERSHGLEGIWESYYEIYNSVNKAVIIEELNKCLYSNKPGRNDKCYCGEDIKYKRCHGIKNKQVMEIGYDNVETIFKILKESTL